MFLLIVFLGFQAFLRFHNGQVVFYAYLLKKCFTINSLPLKLIGNWGEGVWRRLKIATFSLKKKSFSYL